MNQMDAVIGGLNPLDAEFSNSLRIRKINRDWVAGSAGQFRVHGKLEGKNMIRLYDYVVAIASERCHRRTDGHQRTAVVAHRVQINIKTGLVSVL